LGTYNILKKVANSDIEPTFGPERAGDIKHSLADISKAKTLMGYNPQINIEQGLIKAFDWYKKQNN
jgi:UDP-N-acetylglucosamine/UDP-N-acetylgalactosamine 4-epimerase